MGITAASVNLIGNVIAKASNSTLNSLETVENSDETEAKNNNSFSSNQSNRKSSEFVSETSEKLYAADEIRWRKIRKNYPRTPDIINLENGYFSHQSWKTITKHLDFEFDINVETSRFMRTQQQKEIEAARVSFAEFLGINTEELAFTRNTTESLNTVILGYPWKAGDEVMIGDQDYGSMVEAFEQASMRYGVLVKKVVVPQHSNIYRGAPSAEGPQYVYEQSVVKAYTELITEKTRMVHITDLINLSGQVIPTKLVASTIKKINPNILVVVDAAHSLAHTLGPCKYSFPELFTSGVDVIGGSLHKWLCNPIGVGFLAMKKTCIEQIWPLMGDTGVPKNNIRKFEHQGTRPIQSLQTIKIAIDQHKIIGAEAKLQRLQYLKLCWMGIEFSDYENTLFGNRNLPSKWKKLNEQLVDLRTVVSTDGKPLIHVYGLPWVIRNEKLNGSSGKQSLSTKSHSKVQADSFNETSLHSIPPTASSNGKSDVNSAVISDLSSAVSSAGKSVDYSTVSSVLSSAVNSAVQQLSEYNHSMNEDTYFYQGAIATVSITGYSPSELAKTLLEKFGIYTVAIDHPRVKGVRVTPHLSSTFEDCAKLNQALVSLAKK